MKKYRCGNEGSITLSDEVLEILTSWRQCSNSDFEAGGVLLGRLLLGSASLVVDDITVPQSNDQRSRTRFFRSADHQAIANIHWRQSY